MGRNVPRGENGRRVPSRRKGKKWEEPFQISSEELECMLVPSATRGTTECLKSVSPQKCQALDCFRGCVGRATFIKVISSRNGEEKAKGN